MKNTPYPPKPQMPCSPPPYDHNVECDPCCKPPENKFLPGCGPTPPPPCPSPEQYPVCPPPGFGQVPPVPSVMEGSSLYEAMEIQNKRVNQCINQWNQISANCFKYMQECVNAARMNDVYYDQCEVGYEEGYDTTDGCTYSVVRKRSVDKTGKPIYVRLALAYDNTTNSGIKQKIFDVSFIKKANMIITAVPTNQTTWNGPAVYQGAQIPGTEDETGFVYGFTRHGALRYFGGNVTQQALCQNQMMDVIGGCIPALNDGELTTEIQEYTTKGAVCAIGFRCSDGDVFFFQAGNQDQPGMAPVNVAKVLQNYGCTVAVITSFIENNNLNESNGMLYLGQMCQAPTAGKEPDNIAYWYISKGPCFNNTFRETIADLVQTTGQNAWRNYLLGVEVQAFDERITQNHEDILKEVERATQAENWLQENINKEVNRAMQAEEWLQQNINQVQNNLTDEINRAEAAEQALDEKITAETQRATAAENQLASDLAAEKLRAQTRENEIQTALDKEIRERISADNDIINAIEQEVLARRAADTALENKIDAVKNELEQDIQGIQQIVDGITGGQTNLPYLKLTGGTLSGPVNFSSADTITLGRGPTADLEAATKKYVDDAIAGGTTPGGDVSKEYVDQQITAVQTQVDGKVSKTGDTMTGALNMNGNKIENPVLSSNTAISLDNGAGGPGRITNLATPVNDTDAISKGYLESQVPNIIDDVKDSLTGEFLPTAGGTMSGDIDMGGTSKINFYDDATSTAMNEMTVDTQTAAKKVMTKSGTPLDIRPSRVAQELGITKEILKTASDNGVDIQTASVGDIMVFAARNSTVLGALKGTLENNGDNMVLTVPAGTFIINSTKLQLNNDASATSIISNVDHDLIKFTPTSTEILGPVDITNSLGEPTGELTCGTVDAEQVEVGNTTLTPHEDESGISHLDINVNSSAGAVYINRTNNGTVQDGGTGELHVTEIQAPNELRLNPGTNVNLGGKTLKGVPIISPQQQNEQITICNPDGSIGSGLEVNNLSILGPTGNVTAKFTPNGTNAYSGVSVNARLNMTSNKIINLTPGTESTDAATVGQVQSILNSQNIAYSQIRIYNNNITGLTLLADKSITSLSTSFSIPNVPMIQNGDLTTITWNITLYVASYSSGYNMRARFYTDGYFLYLYGTSTYTGSAFGLSIHDNHHVLSPGCIYNNGSINSILSEIGSSGNEWSLGSIKNKLSVICSVIKSGTGYVPLGPMFYLN